MSVGYPQSYKEIQVALTGLGNDALYEALSSLVASPVNQVTAEARDAARRKFFEGKTAMFLPDTKKVNMRVYSTKTSVLNAVSTFLLDFKILRNKVPKIASHI